MPAHDVAGHCRELFDLLIAITDGEVLESIGQLKRGDDVVNTVRNIKEANYLLQMILD
jgi:hypothetical protein